MRVRPAAVAGSFYPADAGELAATVDGLLSAVPAAAAPLPIALLVPHAGYVYSGPVAATAYARLRGARGHLRRVVLLGPAHFVPLRGVAQPQADRWATPLGELPVERVAGLPVSDEPHAPEHALEVQLPFVQRLLGDGVTVLPVAVGRAEPAEVADRLDELCGAPDTILVVSTDLSHYADADTARRLDRRTADAILARDPAAIRLSDACGAFALRGLLDWCVRHGHRLSELDLRASADTAGERSRVVGYGAFAVVDGDSDST
jgi:AmmeMemoRadiSam system protein B